MLFSLIDHKERIKYGQSSFYSGNDARAKYNVNSFFPTVPQVVTELLSCNQLADCLFVKSQSFIMIVPLVCIALLLNAPAGGTLQTPLKVGKSSMTEKCIPTYFMARTSLFLVLNQTKTLNDDI